jgi:hypothetical protein
MNMESVRLLLCATQFTTQVFAIHTEPQLIGVRGVVSEPIVYVVVRNAGTCTKRYLTAKARLVALFSCSCMSTLPNLRRISELC